MITLQFQYKPFIQVDLENNFFEDNILRNFKVEPTSETQRLLDSLGLLFKVSETGFILLADNCKLEKLAIIFEDLKNNSKKLSFVLVVKDPFFKNYTDVPLSSTPSLLYFSNKNLAGLQNGNLHPKDFVCEEDSFVINDKQNLEDLENISAPKIKKGVPTALIDLIFTKELLELVNYKLLDSDLPSFNYKVKFDSRSIYWKYLIVPAYTKKLKDLKVISQNKDLKISFNTAKEPTIIKEKQALAFTSDKALKLQQFYDHSFQLKRGSENSGGKTIIRKLQFAGFDFLKPLSKNEPAKYCSEIYVYI